MIGERLDVWMSVLPHRPAVTDCVIHLKRHPLITVVRKRKQIYGPVQMIQHLNHSSTVNNSTATKEYAAD